MLQFVLYWEAKFGDGHLTVVVSYIFIYLFIDLIKSWQGNSTKKKLIRILYYTITKRIRVGDNINWQESIFKTPEYAESKMVGSCVGSISVSRKPQDLSLR